MNQRPLDGIRVIDLGQIYAAPYCTMQLAAMGAEVIKIEPPGIGEGLRFVGADPGKTNYAFLMLNANKKSVTLNLKDARGRALLMKLLERADVFVENYAGGTMESMGLGYDDLRERFPRLIYASAKGYGSDSRFAKLGAMDTSIQAACGQISATGFPDRDGVKTPATLIDMGTGSHLTSAILAALLGRARSGRGMKVEVAMFDIAVPGMTTVFAAALQGKKIRRSANQHPGVCPSNVYPAADGAVLIFCLTEKHWRMLATMMGRGELGNDPRFVDHTARLKIVDEVDALVAAWTRDRSREELIAALIDNGVPAAPVRTVEEVVSDPELRLRGSLIESHYADYGAINVLGLPFRLDPDRPGRADQPAPPPTLAAHTAEVLAEIGVDQNELERLRSEGVV
ncbi:MAG TPA: CoA transferase [Candidatus Binataceae bacterium]|nr:CoA transferase [Candidatus Binataceae bacterium]